MSAASSEAEVVVLGCVYSWGRGGPSFCGATAIATVITGTGRVTGAPSISIGEGDFPGTNPTGQIV